MKTQEHSNITKTCRKGFCFNVLMFLRSREDGAAALLTVVIVSAAVLVMALGTSLRGVGDLDMGYTAQKGNEALAVADACAEEAIRRLRIESGYTGGTFNIGSGSCILTVSNVSTTYTITSVGTVGDYTKTVQVVITLNGSSTTVDSWEEQ